MSNNARVVSEGEIGSAQYFQALSARAHPDTRMNPVLLKPEADTRSQVVLLGHVDPRLSRMPWRRRSAQIWPPIRRSLDELLKSYDVVVLEGAGSPAEINLQASDIVNMRVARHANANCLLVTDIDRGGAFAHLYGTWKLLSRSDQKRIRGFVLNKFRGDPALLSPGPAMLRKLTGVPTVAILPMWREHGLPEEDGFFEDPRAANPPKVKMTIAVVAYPRISNLDEFQSLNHVPGIHLKWAKKPSDLKGADWIVLPGSKNTISDLAWMRANGFDKPIRSHASAGRPLLGICGGLQMLGRVLKDSHGTNGSAKGLGLLPLETEFYTDKIVRQRQTRFGALTGPWSALSGLVINGYEIHTGRTIIFSKNKSAQPVMAGDLAWQNKQGNILGIYMHGLFENSVVSRALFGIAGRSLEKVFDGLADFVEDHFRPGVLKSLLENRS